MFLVMIDYIKPLSEIDQHLVAHREFLDTWYKKECFIASGPQNPRIGGVLISQLKDREQLWSILQQDPFYVHELALYTLIEFDPVKYHPDFAKFI